jgi:hypothetical protein
MLLRNDHADGAIPSRCLCRCGSADPLTRDERFLGFVQQHGYWLASSQENAAIGLEINRGVDGKSAAQA